MLADRQQLHENVLLSTIVNRKGMKEASNERSTNCISRRARRDRHISVHIKSCNLWHMSRSSANAIMNGIVCGLREFVWSGSFALHLKYSQPTLLPSISTPSTSPPPYPAVEHWSKRPFPDTEQPTPNPLSLLPPLHHLHQLRQLHHASHTPPQRDNSPPSDRYPSLLSHLAPTAAYGILPLQGKRPLVRGWSGELRVSRGSWGFGSGLLRGVRECVLGSHRGVWVLGVSFLHEGEHAE